MSVFTRSISIILTVLLIGACSNPSMAPQVSQEFSNEGLHRVKSSGFEEAYVLPGADLPSYKSVKIEPLQTAGVDIPQAIVSGTTAKDWVMTPQRKENLQRGWAEAMQRTFAAYQQDSSVDHILQIHARLVRIAAGRSSTTATSGAGKPVMGSVDTVDVEVEFRLSDTSTGKLLAVIRDRRTVDALLWRRSATGDMGILFNSWAGYLHTRISGK